MENNILFESKGMRDAASGGFAMAGVVLCLTGVIVAAATGGKIIGPWYLYLAGMGLCIWIIYAMGEKHSVEIKLIERKNNAVFLSISGKANNVEMQVEEYSNWYVVKHRSAKHGGTEVRLHFKATGNDNDELCFTEMSSPGKEPRGWLQHDVQFPIGGKSFMVGELPALVKALDAHEKRNRDNLNQFKELLKT
jgi:hypothetical protein